MLVGSQGFEAKIHFFILHFLSDSLDSLSTASSANSVCTLNNSASYTYFYLATAFVQNTHKVPRCIWGQQCQNCFQHRRKTISVARISWLLFEVYLVVAVVLGTSCLDSAPFHWRIGLINTFRPVRFAAPLLPSGGSGRQAWQMSAQSAISS